MQMNGREVLVGVGFLDRLGWFNVTLMDVDAIIDRRLFAPIAALMGGMLIAAAALLAYLFKRKVLDRLARVEQAVSTGCAPAISTIAEIDPGHDEIGRLSRRSARWRAPWATMPAGSRPWWRSAREKLERLAGLDPLTGMLNRRGFEEALPAGAAGGSRIRRCRWGCCWSISTASSRSTTSSAIRPATR